MSPVYVCLRFCHLSLGYGGLNISVYIYGSLVAGTNIAIVFFGLEFLDLNGKFKVDHVACMSLFGIEFAIDLLFIFCMEALYYRSELKL